MYMVLGELFSPNQASAVYSRALAEIQQNQRVSVRGDWAPVSLATKSNWNHCAPHLSQVKELLGEPVCGYRENDRRGHWKRFDVYDSANGDASGKTAYMRFGVSGPISEGTANAWLHQVIFDRKWPITLYNECLNCMSRPHTIVRM